MVFTTVAMPARSGLPGPALPDRASARLSGRRRKYLHADGRCRLSPVHGQCRWINGVFPSPDRTAVVVVCGVRRLALRWHSSVRWHAGCGGRDGFRAAFPGSTQANERQDCQDHDHESDQIDDAVHGAKSFHTSAFDRRSPSPQNAWGRQRFPTFVSAQRECLRPECPQGFGASLARPLPFHRLQAFRA